MRITSVVFGDVSPQASLRDQAMLCCQRIQLSLAGFMSAAPIPNGVEVWFESRDEVQYRSRQLLPDEELSLTISAEGYEPVEERVKLSEGEKKVLQVTMSKAK